MSCTQAHYAEQKEIQQRILATHLNTFSINQTFYRQALSTTDVKLNPNNTMRMEYN